MRKTFPFSNNEFELRNDVDAYVLLVAVSKKDTSVVYMWKYVKKKRGSWNEKYFVIEETETIKKLNNKKKSYGCICHLYPTTEFSINRREKNKKTKYTSL